MKLTTTRALAIKGVGYSYDEKILQSTKLIASMFCTHSIEVWKHCQRVAKLSEKTARMIGKDKKAAFFGGLFHDLGKIFVHKELFDGRNITDKEYEEVKEHSLMGHSSLKSIHLFSALCCGLHHAMGESGYGLNSKNLPYKMKPSTLKKVLGISSIVSVCDFIDAFSTRKTKIKYEDYSDQKTRNLKKLLAKKFPEDKVVIDVALKAKGKLKLTFKRKAMIKMSCPVCSEVMCDHTSAERKQSIEEMLEDIKSDWRKERKKREKERSIGQATQPNIPVPDMDNVYNSRAYPEHAPHLADVLDF